MLFLITSIVLLSNAFAVHADGFELLQLPELEHNASSILCIIKFCEKLFRSEKAVRGSLVIANVQNMTSFHSQLIIMLNEKTNYELGVMVKDARRKHGSAVHVTDKAKNYFVIFNETSEVMEAINMWNKLPTWNPLAKVIALFENTYEHDVLNEKITKILRDALSKNMINTFVISYRYNTDIVQAHTWYPYEENNCANDIRKLHLIDECQYSDQMPTEPIITTIAKVKKKIPNNLHGCELHIAGSVNEPFVFYETDTKDFVEGTEVLMARTISQALKMKPIFFHINETRENRIISNETGIYSTLLQRKADILIGGMDNDARVQKMLWITIPYIQDDQTWCVATARPQDIWRNIFGIYTGITWTALIAVVFFIALIIYILIRLEKKTENYVWTLLIGMSVALGQYASYEPTRSSIRVMMVFLFMYGLIMSSSFNSFLISILTRPKYKQQIGSLTNAIQAAVQFTGGEVALSHYLGGDEVSIKVRQNFKICDFPDDCLERLISDDKLAVASSRLHAVNSPVISEMDIFCFPRSNNIYSYSVAMPIKLDFHLLPTINYIIRQLFEFGLIERWNKLSQAIASSDLNTKRSNNKNGGDDNNLVVLTVAHIMGAILIMIFGHAVALIAFVSEQIVYRKIKDGTQKRVWLILHRFLNPK